jgi:signal transduction histidine kinase
VRNATGQVVKWFGTCTDIDDQKRVETDLAQALAVLHATTEKLEHTNKMQNDFVSIISHEFRTPLTAIQGFSELMRDEEFSFQEVKEYAADINADARRLTRMINELLDLNRMKSGRMTLNLEHVDLNAIIGDVVDHIRPTTLCHRFHLQLDDTLPPLSGDRDKLIQVVTNLLSNAIKYSPSGGAVLLSSAVDGQVAHVRVQDQGMGIPADALEHIFESYSRIESEANKYIQGTGLGLPIVRQIVQMHGGKVWAESVLGQGSIFHFTVPVHREKEVQQWSSSEPSSLRSLSLDRSRLECPTCCSHREEARFPLNLASSGC